MVASAQVDLDVETLIAYEDIILRSAQPGSGYLSVGTDEIGIVEKEIVKEVQSK